MAAPARDDTTCPTSELVRHGAEDSDPFADVDKEKEELELMKLMYMRTKLVVMVYSVC